MLHRFLRCLLVIFQKTFYFLTFKRFPPPFSSALCIVVHKDHVLLLERSDGLGLSLPGGFIGLYESGPKCAERECFEETGVRVKVIKLITVLSGEREGTSVGSVDLIYECDVVDDSGFAPSKEGTPHWVETHQKFNNVVLGYSSVLNDYFKRG